MTLAEILAEAELLDREMGAVLAAQIADAAPELNPLNYTHDEVCELNAAMIRVSVLISALSAPAPAVPEAVREAAEKLRAERLKYRASPGLYIRDDMRAARRRIGVLTDALLDAIDSAPPAPASTHALQR